MIFDLDGTLVDASDRMFMLFCELVPKCHLTKDEYWALKRDKVSHREILMSRYGYTTDDFMRFERQWMDEIESPKSIARDRMLPCVAGLLPKLKSFGFDLYVVTARQDPVAAEAEVKAGGIGAFLDGVLATGPDRDKRRALAPLAPFSRRDVFVGDVGRDVELGRSLGGFTVAVANGFQSRKRLAEYSPDLIIDDVGGLLDCRIIDCREESL